MKLIFGILLFSLSIIMSELSHGIEEQSSLVGAQVQSSAVNPELLEPEYVQLSVSEQNVVSVSILQTFNQFARVVQTKFYSLLNWRQHQRRTGLVIENYDRKLQFGRWINDPNDDVCFNTRVKVLVRDSKKPVVFKDTNRCAVAKGAWKDPYTNAIYNQSLEIQIDHFVPLKNAYLSGAHKWSFRARCLYANYLGNEFHLIPVEARQNMKKGDRSPAKYMPPTKAYTCTYLKNWLSVKMLWGLTMTTDEANAVRGLILENKCDLAKFRISDRELSSQRQYAKENIDLCEKIDKANRL